MEFDQLPDVRRGKSQLAIAALETGAGTILQIKLMPSTKTMQPALSK
jgi:hypothetical protein